jgi:hypothetical protein
MNRQNSLFLVVFVVLLLFVGGVFSGQISFSDIQENQVEQIVPASVDDLVSSFLYHLSAGRLERVYNKTTGNFRAFTPFAEFEVMIEYGRFHEVKEVKYVSLERPSQNILALSADLIMNNDESQRIVFSLLQDNESWLLDGLTTSIDPEFVLNTFPVADDLFDFVGSHLNVFKESLVNLDLRAHFYNGMSRAGRRAVSYEHFTEVLDEFAVQGFNISFSHSHDFVFSDDSPQIEGNNAKVSGTYANDTHNVEFSFLYDFEWKWKVNSFSIHAVPKESAEE